jgi:glycosyltransferase involved in cell wall biosynthesis
VRRVLHLVPQLSLGGGSRAALTAATVCRADDEQHVIASIRPSVGAMATSARDRGIELLDGVARERLVEQIEASDITLLHLWNSPELLELLESELPPFRLLVWTHVAGNTAPQILPPEIFARAAETVVTSEISAERVRRFHPGTAPELIPPVGGWERVQDVVRSDRPGFNVGYVGTLTFSRIKPTYVSMSLAAAVDAARFIVCGHGSAAAELRREARERGAADRFDFRGQIGEIGRALADFDLFGYPLRANTSASSDLSVKEAMYAGVPPVVLAETACDRLVADGVTGVVAPDDAAYARAIERLHADADERRRLAENAREYAADQWTPSKWVPAWRECFDRVMSRPRRGGPVLSAPDPALPEGTTRFVRGLGEWGRDFEVSLSGSAAEAEAAERRIQRCDPMIAYDDNGLLDHRRRYPDEPMLALWTGLFLRGNGRPALGAGELARAGRLGCDPVRIARHATTADAA